MTKALIFAAAMAAIGAASILAATAAEAGDAAQLSTRSHAPADGSQAGDPSICDHVFAGDDRENTAVRTWCKEGAIGGRYAIFFNAIRQGWMDESPFASSMDQTYCAKNRIESGANDPFQTCGNALLSRATAARKAEEYRQEQSVEADRQARNHEIAIAKETAAKLAAIDNENGYKRITIADVLLDGKTLAKENQKVSLAGTYVHEPKTDWLYPANVWARNRDESNGILLIKDNATREFRLLLMNTWSRTDAEFGAKGFSVLGHVSMCDLTTLTGTEHLPCLIVEDGHHDR
jgi:hypothetical protein